MKKCPKCNLTKPYFEFGKHSYSKDGYRCHCKKCIYNDRILKQNNITKYKRELYQKQKQDPLFNLKKRIRNAMRRAHLLNGFKKNNLTNNLLGCEYEFFKSYIEAQFTKDMNWDNIHLDHIKPLSSANTIEEVYQISHYTNFQPLLAKDNIIKQNKLIEKQLRLI